MLILQKSCKNETCKENQGERQMYATIQVSPYVHVQGEVTRRLPNGAVVIHLGGRDYVGAPLSQTRAEFAVMKQ